MESVDVDEQSRSQPTDVHDVGADVSPADEDEPNDLRSSAEEVWYLKEITFQHAAEDQRPRTFKIITQNYNGPCSFIAICNILIMRGNIEILPLDRTTVSYDLLAHLVVDYLLNSSPDIDISSALTMLPLTTRGMDLNPLFTSQTAFRPAGISDNGALDLFARTGIPLVHGWLVDPHSPEYEAISKLEDYDNAVNAIVEADHIMKGQFVRVNGGEGENRAGPSTGGEGVHLSEGDRRKVEDAMAARTFLDTTQSQLTYHGLFTLASTLPPNTPVALFRNSHLAVLYKSQTSQNDDENALYTLVTDQVFLNEPSIVWERLADVDQGAAAFVDGIFRKSSPAGGDWAGHTGESALAALEGYSQAGVVVDPAADHALARRLQEEEDAYAHQVYARRQHERQAQMQAPTPPTPPSAAMLGILDSQITVSRKKKKDCVIM
ncbi:hypothetical protein EW146_g9070 [Bondarzewia mesenterica]|uniref:MINDY deubiquitinase domain-containing protein n=2 Tax=Bondarzewia mesenterica TaxID=1095465 RepID=A0A4S4L9G1_9AGAM|nr:hypothetical protein EW146_g9070 [Bondarzewia mesenterica]